MLIKRFKKLGKPGAKNLEIFNYIHGKFWKFNRRGNRLKP